MKNIDTVNDFVNFYKLKKDIKRHDEGKFDYHEFFFLVENGIFHYQLLKDKIVKLIVTIYHLKKLAFR